MFISTLFIPKVTLDSYAFWFFISMATKLYFDNIKNKKT
jgi:hypothetical protein